METVNQHEVDVEKREDAKSSPAAMAQVFSGKDWAKHTITPYLLLAVVHILYGGHQTLSREALVSRLNPFLFNFYRNFVAFLFLAPAAYYLERDVRPKMSLATFGSFNILAVLGVSGSQQLFLAGLALTSPLYTAVSQNMIPVFTFLFAALLGMEQICFRKRSGLAKIFGTLICITGGVTMTLYKGVPIYEGEGYRQDDVIGMLHLFKHITGVPSLLHVKIGFFSLGVLCLLLNCCSWALYFIYQGTMLPKYPALLSMVTYIELFGTIQLGIVGALVEGPKLEFLDFRLISKDQLIIILYAGIVASGINVVLQAWCVRQVGAFIVSLFNPFQTLVVACLAIVLLGDSLYMGMLIGGTLIVVGFYIVICGQQMERSKGYALEDLICSKAGGKGTRNADTKQPDIEEPLLPSHDV